MPTSSFRIAAAAAALLACAHVTAQEAQPIKLNIPAQRLDKALNVWADQTGYQVMIPVDDPVARERTAPKVEGTYTPEGALKVLLASSDLKYRFVSERAVTIRSAAAAQDQSGPSATQSSAPALEEIVVTGTNIRGAAPAGADVRKIDRAAIEQSGRATIQDLIQVLPQNFAGGVNEASSIGGRMGGSSVNYNYGSSINLRGLGQDSTLVLLNGRRMAPAGIGDFVDVSAIPLTAVDRVEIVADGASATYGSDAMGGVVNFITQQSFDGARTGVRFGSVSSGGLHETQASQLLGTAWSGGGLTAAYEFYSRGNLPAAERSYAASTDLRPLGGHDFRSTFSAPGNITSPGSIAGGIPPGQDGSGLTAGEILVGQPNLQNQRLRTDVLPEQRRHSFLLNASQELGRAKVYFDGLYSHRESDVALAAATATLSVPTSNAFRQMNGLLAGDARPISINYSFLDDAGPQRREGTTQAYSSTAGVEVDVGGTWQLDVSTSIGENEDRSRLTGTPDTRSLAAGGALNASLASGDPASAFNPFGSGGNTDDAVVSRIFAPIDIEYESRFESAGIRADGGLFNLPGGPMKLAVGGEYRKEHFDNSQVTNYASGAVIAATPRGQRSVTAGFVELSIPLFTDSNRRPGFERAQLSLSTRYDDYSDFGSTTNPKVGLEWAPIRGLTFRGTYGTSFKAPRISDLHTLSTGLVAPLPTILGGPDLNGDGLTSLLLLGGGNARLKPEKGKTWTAGVTIEPAPALHVRASYFNVHFEDRIARLATLTVPFSNPAAYQGLVYFVNPNQSQVDSLVQSVDSFSGAAPAPDSVEAIVDLRTSNISVVDVDGIDLDADYTASTSLGRLSFIAGASYVLAFREKFAPALPAIDTVDTIGHPIGLRARGGVSWARGDLGASLFLNYQDDYTNTEITPNEKIGSLTTADLQLRYSAPANLSSWLRGLSAALIVTNLFDKTPPFTDSLLGGFDSTNASPLGRFAAFEITKHW